MDANMIASVVIVAGMIAAPLGLVNYIMQTRKATIKEQQEKEIESIARTLIFAYGDKAEERALACPLSSDLDKNPLDHRFEIANRIRKIREEAKSL